MNTKFNIGDIVTVPGNDNQFEVKGIMTQINKEVEYLLIEKDTPYWVQERYLILLLKDCKVCNNKGVLIGGFAEVEVEEVCYACKGRNIKCQS
jgi:hypothetical protein